MRLENADPRQNATVTAVLLSRQVPTDPVSGAERSARDMRLKNVDPRQNATIVAVLRSRRVPADPVYGRVADS